MLSIALPSQFPAVSNLSWVNRHLLLILIALITHFLKSSGFLHSLTSSHSCLANSITKSILPSVCSPPPPELPRVTRKIEKPRWLTLLQIYDFWCQLNSQSCLAAVLLIPAWLVFPFHTAAVATTPCSDPQPCTLIPLNLNTRFYLLPLRTVRLSAMNPPCFLPSSASPNLSVSLLIKTSFCISK